MTPILPSGPLRLRKSFVVKRALLVGLALIGASAVGVAAYRRVATTETAIATERAIWNNGQPTQLSNVSWFWRDEGFGLRRHTISFAYGSPWPTHRGRFDVKLSYIGGRPKNVTVRVDPADPSRYALSWLIGHDDARLHAARVEAFQISLAAIPFLLIALLALRSWRLAHLAVRDPIEATCPLTTNQTRRPGARHGLMNVTFNVPQLAGIPRSAVRSHSRSFSTKRLPLFANQNANAMVVLLPRAKPRRPLALREDFYPIALNSSDHAATSERLRQRRSGWAPSIGVPRGFAHLAQVRRAVATLRSKRYRLPEEPTTRWSSFEGYNPSDPLISVQRLARSIAEVYSLHVGAIIVSFHDNIDAAGRVELTPGNEFFVEINRRLVHDPTGLAATLAHEIAHIFLYRAGIVFDNTADNEILTDSAAVLWGFGPLMINTFRTEERRLNEQQMQWREEKIGYLTPEEIGYLVEMSRSGNAPIKVQQRQALFALNAGRRRAAREAATPPLETSGAVARAIYRLRRYLGRKTAAHLRQRYWFEEDGARVSFRCPRCTQSMRLPTRKSITATCPNCATKLPCRT